MVWKTMKAGLRLGRSIASCVLASSGFRLDTLGRHTIFTAALALAGYAFHQAWIASPSAGPGRVYGYFIVLFAIRYVYLFGSFVPGGIAERLIGRFGEKRGYRIYEIGTAWMFFQRGLTFAPLVALHPWSLLSFAGVDASRRGAAMTLCIVAGAAMTAVGFLINISSTLVVGFDVYYYKDLFLRRAVGSFEVRGPYRYLSNPMYGLGQLSGYGAALMLGSLEGLVATALNQVLMYGFYYAIEKPHIAAVFSKAPRPRSVGESGTFQIARAEP